MAASVNKNRTAQQIRADRNFQKQIEEHVKISGRRIIVLSLEDNKVAKLGEESLVRLAVERGEDINLKDMENYMKGMGEPSCGTCRQDHKCKEHKYGLRYVKSPASVSLPPMKYKIDGPSWSLNVGRNQLTTYMLLEGYGEGGSLSYKEDRPAWWPESIDHEKWFEKYRNPGLASIKHSALFLRAILQHYGHDAENYHNEVIHEESEPKRNKPQRKWKPKKSKQVVLDDTIDEDNEVEEANRARAAQTMEAARAGVRDTAETSDMEDVHDTADDHYTAVEERYEVVEVIQGEDKPCYICRAFTAEILFFCRSCYNPYHQLCLQMQHLPQHKGLNGSGSMCGRCLNSKDSYEEDMNNRAKSIEAKCEEINGKQYQVISFLSDPDQDKLDQDLNLDTVDPWEMPQLPSFGLQSLNDLPGSYDVDFDRYLQTNGLAISLGE